jgi:phage terminase small subunit
MAEKPPKHLRTTTKRWWSQVNADYALADHHRRILTLACEAWDRAQQAREALEAAGSLTYEDRFAAPRARPEVAMERDARIGFARLVRELALDDDDMPDVRPPRLRTA